MRRGAPGPPASPAGRAGSSAAAPPSVPNKQCISRTLTKTMCTYRIDLLEHNYTVCLLKLDPIHEVTHYTKWGETFCTHSNKKNQNLSIEENNRLEKVCNL